MHKFWLRAKDVSRYWVFHAIDRFAGIPFVFLLFPFKSFLRGENAAYKRILIIKLTLMGDTILLIPTLRAIREKFPGAKISIILSGVNAGVLKNCPYVDEEIIVPLEKLINPFYLTGLINFNSSLLLLIFENLLYGIFTNFIPAPYSAT